MMFAMEQMKLDGLEIVAVNFDDPSLPEHARQLRPLIWHDGDAYCVLLGPDPQSGVFGCEKSLEAALDDWNNNVRERLAHPRNDDEVAQFIKDNLNASVYKIN